MLDYQCPRGHRFESLEKRGAEPETIECPATIDLAGFHGGCYLPATVTLSAPMVGTNWAGDVSRGKSDPRPPGVLDTRALAEGMPLKEWKQKRAEYWRDKDRAEIKQKAG
jgi:hypothetical protein